jgi:uncharacterized membrane protein YeaQ/YmgE (transglycosylase-associated protein family)
MGGTMSLQLWRLLVCLILLGNVSVAGEKKLKLPASVVEPRAGDDAHLEKFAIANQQSTTINHKLPGEDRDWTTFAHDMAHQLLLWIGFGTLVGLTAKAIMPGPDPGGPVATLLMGIAGSLIGCGVLLLFGAGFRVTPISPLGFLAGTAGAFLLLLFYRILSHSYLIEHSPRSFFKRTAKPSV